MKSLKEVSKFLFPLLAAVVLFTHISSVWALLMGITAAILVENPYQGHTKKMVPKLLQGSIIGMGGGMNFYVVCQAGLSGILYTIMGIFLTLIIGDHLLRKWLKTEAETSFLITVGTAICGGSAIAAVSSVIKAKEENITAALAIVFALNSLALAIFPPLGHYFHLSETQFGLWSALAIHDTSSVVGASMLYGPHALEVATTVKLTRALWILPLSLLTSWGWIGSKLKHNGSGSAKIPWFILGFFLIAALVTWVPEIRPVGQMLHVLAKRLLVFTLFLIGANLNLKALKSMGPRPFIQGILLWLIVSTGTLTAILFNWIK